MSVHRQRIHGGAVLRIFSTRVLRQRGVWRSRSSLREVTTTEQLLAQALGQVVAVTQATLELAENDGTSQLIFTVRRCLDVQNLLEDACAVIDVDMVDPVDAQTPHELLRLAADAFCPLPLDDVGAITKLV
jgi:hypothetical protein